MKIQITKDKEKILKFFFSKKKCYLQENDKSGITFPITSIECQKTMNNSFKVLMNNVTRIIKYFLYPLKGSYLRLDYIQTKKKIKMENILASFEITEQICLYENKKGKT